MCFLFVLASCKFLQQIAGNKRDTNLIFLLAGFKQCVIHYQKALILTKGSFFIQEVCDFLISLFKKLKEVKLGRELTQIGYKCFYKDSKLKKVLIRSKKLKKVGKESMRGTPVKHYGIPEGCGKKYKKLLKKAE